MSEDGLRVLHVLPSLKDEYGGPLRMTLDVAARAESLGLSSDILGVGEQKIRDNPVAPSRIHSVPLGTGGARYAYSPALRGWLRKHLASYDGVVVHGAWTYPGWAASVECERVGVPYACVPQGMLEQWAVHGQGWITSTKKRLYWHFREKRVWQNARAVFFSTALEQERKAFRVESHGLVLHPYGMELDVERVPSPQNKLLLQPPELKIALFLGRTHPKKNPHLLIEAWKQAEVGPEWRLVIAGSGPESYQAEMAALIRRYKLEDRVSLPGFVTGLDKAYLLQRANWFLLPSSQENFGVAVLEAVQHRCAVAISNGVFLAESLRPSSEVMPPTLEAWTEFFRTRMQDASWNESVRELDYQHLIREFGMDHVVEDWVDKLTETFRPRPVGTAKQ